MTQNARNRTMMNMHRGKIRLLVATDVAARGLDITGISHVINFDLPRSAEDYVNRIGRTGRNGESGIAISFASQGELAYLDRIERYIGKALTMHVIPGLEPDVSAEPAEQRAKQRPASVPDRPPAIPARTVSPLAAPSAPGARKAPVEIGETARVRLEKWDREVTVEYRRSR